MKLIQKNDWYLLNEIIYEVYTIPMKNLLMDIESKLKPIIKYDYSIFQFYETGGMQGEELKICSKNLSKEYLEQYERRHKSTDFTNWILASNESITLRISDILTKQVFKNSEIYRNWMLPMGIEYGLISAIASRGKCQAAIFLYRDIKQLDFSKKEVEILAVINGHLCNRISQEMNTKMVYLPEGNLKEFAKKYGLTSKEFELLSLVAMGSKRSDLAEKLYISNNTLKKHLANIYLKLEISTFEELLSIIHNKLIFQNKVQNNI